VKERLVTCNAEDTDGRARVMLSDPRNVTSGASRGLRKKFPMLAIARNLWSPHNLCYNSTTDLLSIIHR